MRTARTTVAAAAWIPLVMLAVDPGGWYPFGPSKWLVISAGVLILAVATLGTRRLRVVPSVQLATIVLVAIFAVAAARGLDPTYAWLGTPERHFGLITWMLLAVALCVGINLAEPAKLLWGTALAGTAIGTAATAEALGWEPRIFDVDDRLSATYGSPAYLGAAVALLLPIAAATALDTALPRRLRLLAAVGVPLLAVALLGSGARAAWLGITGAVVMVCARWRRHLATELSTRALVGAAVVLTGFVVAVVMLSPVGARVTSTFDDDAPGGRGRLDEWRVAVNVARDHLALGVGPEGYRIAFAEGVDASYERAHGRNPAPDRAHSAPLEIVLTGGVGALVLWCAFVMMVGRHVWRALGNERLWLAGLGTALVAHFVGQLVLFPLAELEPIVWLLAGVVVANTAHSSEVRGWRVPRAAVAVSGAVALMALAAGVTDIVADRRAYDAVRARSRGEVEAAYARASSASSLRPDELRLHLLKAETAREADRGIIEALDAIGDALVVSPRDPIVVARHLTLLVDRAESTLVPAHAAEARAALGTALVHDPFNSELRVLEGRAARLVDDDAAAEAAWRIAEDLAPRSPIPAANLALLYVDQGRLDEARVEVDRASQIAPDDPFVMAVRARVESAR
jgi:O-antigen ligase/Flp pilus assembly protein TadD